MDVALVSESLKPHFQLAKAGADRIEPVPARLGDHTTRMAESYPWMDRRKAAPAYISEPNLAGSPGTEVLVLTRALGGQRHRPQGNKG
jgi:hypothetical protein